MGKHKIQSKLTLFDVTNLVVGAIIGADIYIASSFGAGLLGPLSLLAWVIAGIIAVIIALCFAQCAALVPKVGGPYAYSKAAWGTFSGFIVGWSLWLAEWVSLAVFPVAFTRYFMFFLPNLNLIEQTFVKAVFVAFLITTNIVGVKAAGRTNDILTAIKITPLIFFSGAGLLFLILNPAKLVSNLSPIAPFGFSNFGAALVLIFWAYAGFEISTIPADEIENPKKTIPRAIFLGITIVTIFYLVTNVVLFGVSPWQDLASDTTPLASSISSILSWSPALALIGGTFVAVGALFSIAGSDESGMIGTSRLSYALAADGLFPALFAKKHPRFKTPYVGIIVQAVTALLASLLADLSTLVATSVFLLSFAYLATSGSVIALDRKFQKDLGVFGYSISVLGIVFSIYLITQCDTLQILAGLGLLSAGIPIYIKYTPKKELAEIKNEITSGEFTLEKIYREEDKFLAHLLRHIKRVYRKKTGRKQTWKDSD
jgi:amino acid transporter